MSQSRSDVSDRQAVAAATLAVGLLIALQVAARAVRDALFLSAFQVSALPLVMGASAGVALAGAETLSFALARRSPARVVPAAAALSGSLFALWWVVGLAFPRAAAVGVYLHVAAFGGALVSGFWSLVNERFDPYTARKVVGRIGTGATAGGVAGGALAWVASRFVPLPATVLGLVALSALGAAALARARGRDASPPVSAPVPPAPPPFAAAVLFRNPYLRSIALVVALGTVVETVVDFLFKAQAAGRFAAGGSLLGAFAAFHAGVSLLGLLLQASLSRLALRHLGIAGTLALRPALTAAGAMLGAAVPRFSTATIARGAHESLTNSLFRSAYELLYTPLPESEKRRVKAFVDVAVDKAGALLGSGLVAVALALAAASVAPVLFGAAAALSLAALALSRRLHQGYVRTLEQSLLAGRVRLDPEDVLDQATEVTLAHTSLIERSTLLRQIEELRGGRPPSGLPAAPAPEPPPSPAAPPAPDTLGDRLRSVLSGDPAVVRRALRASADVEPALVACVLPLLGTDELFPDVLRSLRRAAPRVTGQLVDALLDPAGDPVVRRRIPRVLKACPTERAAQGLQAALDDPSFDIRASAAAALAALQERSAIVRMTRGEVLDRVRRELDSGEPVDRQLPQLFALLSLTLERSPLQIAWTAMRSQDRTLRGTALEYLANVLPDDVFPRIRSCFGASALPAPATRRPVEQVAEELRVSSVGLRIEQPPWREGGEG